MKPRPAGDRRDQLRRRIQELKNLPSLPLVVQKALQMVESSSASGRELSAEIEQDAALTARVLKLVNSAFYGSAGTVSTVSHALVLLGFQVVKGVVLSASVFDMMDRGMMGLWEHSLGCGIAARAIARHTGICEPEEASVCGLLHDVGKLALMAEAPKSYTKLIDAARLTNHFLLDLENETMGTDHAEAGGWLAERWNLPKALIVPIRYHHKPEFAEDDLDRSAIVHVADVLIKAHGYGFSGDEKVLPLRPFAREHLKLTLEDIETIVRDMSAEIAKAQAAEV
jgi:putative nucleotidyltransferase with HDIG domain